MCSLPPLPHVHSANMLLPPCNLLRHDVLIRAASLRRFSSVLDSVCGIRLNIWVYMNLLSCPSFLQVALGKRGQVVPCFLPSSPFAKTHTVVVCQVKQPTPQLGRLTLASERGGSELSRVCGLEGSASGGFFGLSRRFTHFTNRECYTKLRRRKIRAFLMVLWADGNSLRTSGRLPLPPQTCGFSRKSFFLRRIARRGAWHPPNRPSRSQELLLILGFFALIHTIHNKNSTSIEKQLSMLEQPKVKFPDTLVSRCHGLDTFRRAHALAGLELWGLLPFFFFWFFAGAPPSLRVCLEHLGCLITQVTCTGAPKSWSVVFLKSFYVVRYTSISNALHILGDVSLPYPNGPTFHAGYTVEGCLCDWNMRKYRVFVWPLGDLFSGDIRNSSRLIVSTVTWIPPCNTMPESIIFLYHHKSWISANGGSCVARSAFLTAFSRLSSATIIITSHSNTEGG
ncbi:hypothetical protein VP01_418g2 [Puccinia sorghi]|uniref:Uncharacterized protein n=1 Tax=Puccinia sorghi TaxID=27349 RepID=A0A0L6UST8_9BASI|nr:hypothetical protein VP01_418g2 [Puccinia sorghi]